MSTVLAGLAGGLIATILMTVVMMVMGDGGPPPTAMLVAKFAGGEPADYEMPGMALHMLYGIVAGAVLAVGAPLAGLGFSSMAVAVGIGLVYGVVLLIVGMAFWMKAVIGADADRDTMMTFVVVHLVYGIVLGAFLGTGVLA